MSDVEGVLRQLGIEAGTGSEIIEVWNKIDRLSPERREEVRNAAARHDEQHPVLLVSAQTGEGIDALLAAIEQRLAAKRVTLDLTIDAADGSGISWLHRNAEVLEKQLAEGRYAMTVRVDPTKRDSVVKKFGAVERARD